LDISKCAEYINANVDAIAKVVDVRLEESKSDIRKKLVFKLKDYVTPVPVHYVWKYDGDPYDSSGIIVSDGNVDMDQTVQDFLDNEYTGNREATYLSHMGWNYITYGEDLSYDTLAIGNEILLSVIFEHLYAKFGVSLSDDDLFDLRDECNNFDDIYENCLVYEFFMSNAAIEFVGLTDIKLVDVLNMEV
jgi:hypothetical protein